MDGWMDGWVERAFFFHYRASREYLGLRVLFSVGIDNSGKAIFLPT